MLAQLSTLKARLGIAETDLQYDDLPTNTLLALSARFDKECNRTFARTVDATHEFDSDDLEIIPPIYPIESVTKFELKQNETDGWIEQTDVEFIIRKGCTISLKSQLPVLSSFSGGGNDFGLARITYTGGFLLPGSADVPSATRLPSDIEQAAIEQAAAWFYRKDQIGLEIRWDKGGAYLRLSQLDLLPQVRAVLRRYERWAN